MNTLSFRWQRGWWAAAATLAAIFISFTPLTALADQDGPPGIPRGAVGTGRGLDLGTTKASGGRLGKNEDGETVLFVKWVYWRLYMIPTNRTDPQLVLQCWQKCKKKKDHWHPGGCSLDSCCVQDENEKHEGEVTSGTNQEYEAALEEALSRTSSVGGEITAEVNAGFEAEGFSVGGSLSGTRSWGEESMNEIRQSVRQMFGRSKSGTIRINIGHFCTEPCSVRERGYGTREWEVHLVWQVFEQPYKPTGGWVIGTGPGGVLPSGDLKLAGEPRWIGRPHDEKLGTVSIPTDAPLFDRPVPYKCPCEPPWVETPSGGKRTDPPRSPGQDDKKHGYAPYDLPEAGALVNVKVDPGDKVVIHNPFDAPMLITDAETKATITVEPQQKKPCDDKWRAVSVAVGGVLLYNLLADGGGGVSQPAPCLPKQYDKLKDAEIVSRPLKLANKQTVEALPRFGPAVETPLTKQDNLQVTFGGLPTERLPAGDNFRPIVSVQGVNLPQGSSFSAEPVGGAAAKPVSTAFATVESQDGTIKGAVLRIAAPLAAGASTGAVKLVATTPEGAKIEQTLEIKQCNLGARFVPHSGKPGSKTELIVDYKEWLKATQLERPGFDLSQYELQLDYSQSSGAKGPDREPINASGLSKVRITRGAAPGSFPVGIKIRPKQ